MKNILVVDDEKDVTDYLRLELEEYGFNVICKNAGYLALIELNRGDIDLLLTDIAMPDMDGFELYSRAKELNEDLPIIMMTGFGYDPGHAVVKSKKAGLKDVILKPFETSMLVAKINKRIAEKCSGKQV